LASHQIVFQKKHQFSHTKLAKNAQKRPSFEVQINLDFAMSGVCHTHLKQPLAASCQFAPAPQHQLAQLPVSPGVPAFLLRQGRGVWVNIQQPFKPNGPNQKQKLNKSHGIHGTICIFYLHENHKNELNVGKYTSPMDPMGMHGLIQGPFLVD